MHARLRWSQGAAGGNASGLGARLEWAVELVGGEKWRQWVPLMLPDFSLPLSLPSYCFIYTTSTEDAVLECHLKCERPNACME